MYLRRHISGIYYFRCRLKTAEISISLQTTKRSFAKQISTYIKFRLDLLMNTWEKEYAPFDLKVAREQLRCYFEEAIKEYGTYEENRHQALTEGIISHETSEENAIFRTYHYGENDKDLAQGILDEIKSLKKLILTRDDEIGTHLRTRKREEIEFIAPTLKDSFLRSFGEDCDLPFVASKPDCHSKDTMIYDKELFKTQLNILEVDAKRIGLDPNAPTIQKPTVLLSVAITQYLEVAHLSKRWGKSLSATQVEAYLKMCLFLLGDKPVNYYVASDFQKLQANLFKIPVNMNKYSIFRNTTPENVFNANKKLQYPTLHITTINNHLMHINALFTWAVKQDYCDKNRIDMKSLKIKDTRSSKDKRLAYDSEDFINMFESNHFCDVKKTLTTKHEWFWIPLIAMFSGMRLTEICQLHLEDIIDSDGVMCFDVNDNDPLKTYKRVKNKNARRLVPIHSFLLDCGLLSLLEQQKKKKQKRLFSFELTDTVKIKGWGWYFEKRFGEFNRKFITQDTKKTFHSFRHTVADILMKESFEKKLVVECIMGHASQGETFKTYAKGLFSASMNEVLQELRYPTLGERLEQLKAQARGFYKL